MTDEQLIKGVRKYRCLYAKDSKEYRSQEKRAKAWQEIAESIQAPESDCKCRWRSIRDRYVRIHKILLANSEVSINDIQWPNLKHLEFLYDHVRPSRKQIKKTVFAKTEIVNEASEDTEMFSPFEEKYMDDTNLEFTFNLNEPEQSSFQANSSQSSTHSDNKRESKGIEIEKQLSDLLIKVENFKQQGISSNHQHDVFFKLLEPKLNTLPEENQDEVKLAIINYVFGYVKNFRNNESTEHLKL